ncbi:hypothetical protein, partial [uncultured Corynebacterium sp.]|uniref:hypothetical protein n=1 Tax=uncultured Corynebacterium sp. TaxID=159447 RepID=UPI002804B3A1
HPFLPACPSSPGRGTASEPYTLRPYRLAERREAQLRDAGKSTADLKVTVTDELPGDTHHE